MLILLMIMIIHLSKIRGLLLSSSVSIVSLKNKKNVSSVLQNIFFKPLIRHKKRYFSTMPVQGFAENWSLKNLKAGDLISKAKSTIAKSQSTYDDISAIPDEEVSFTNVLKVLADDYCSFLTTQYYVTLPQYVSVDESVRDASCAAEKLIKEYLVESNMRHDVFKKLQILQSKNLALNEEGKRYLDKLILNGKRNGLHLPKETQKEIKSLQNKINSNVILFCKHLNEVNKTFEFSDEELAGMPNEFVENLKKNPDTGKNIVSLNYPDYFPIMQKCRVPETRRQMEFAFNTRCVEENFSLLQELVELRHKVANLLGYPNHASFVTEILMAKTADNVYTFLTQLQKKLAPSWKEEQKVLLEFKEKECQDLSIPFDGKIYPYDIAYYINKVKEIKYNIDQTKLKEYFPTHIVIKRILIMYQKLLGVKFWEIPDAEVWHEDVKLYNVKDAETSELLGYFYLDLFPRAGKYNHACLIEMQPSCLLLDGSRQISVAGMLANFTQSKTDKPSLMDHNEVEIFFHEFGHIMHYICAKADYAMFSNTRVERDFVEAPSQMLENWCWEVEPLKQFSCHYADQSTIPDSFINNLVKSKLANVGFAKLRLIISSLYDFKLHSSGKADVKQTYIDLANEIIGITPTEGTVYGCSFLHLARDYDSKYYSYMWSEVFSMDMFETCFKKGNNILNPKHGMEYRRKILQHGGSKDATDMLIDFLGRPPSQEPFLRSLGLDV